MLPGGIFLCDSHHFSANSAFILHRTDSDAIIFAKTHVFCNDTAYFAVSGVFQRILQGKDSCACCGVRAAAQGCTQQYAQTPFTVFVSFDGDVKLVTANMARIVRFPAGTNQKSCLFSVNNLLSYRQANSRWCGTVSRTQRSARINRTAILGGQKHEKGNLSRCCRRHGRHAAGWLRHGSQQRRCFQRGRKHCGQHHCRVYCCFRSRSQRGPRDQHHRSH